MTRLPVVAAARSARRNSQALRFLQDHAIWFLLEAFFIIAFMAAHLGIELSGAPVDFDATTCIVGLACGAWIGGVTAGVVAFTAFFVLLLVDLLGPKD